MVYGDPVEFEPLAWPRDNASVAEAGAQIREHLRAHVAWAKGALQRDLPGPLPKGETLE